MKSFCKYAFDHQPNETCPHCKLEVDQYGNTEEDFPNCSFPDCGCDGARLCYTGNPNENAVSCNVEGMYNRKDKEAIDARIKLLEICRTKN